MVISLLVIGILKVIELMVIPKATVLASLDT